ncbi:MAG TPA: FAD-dependent oxidoreductase, partial [Thermoflexia bacterium]|nr:FAD-dependent oxidoreductase [Thermoflexia bacterium]
MKRWNGWGDDIFTYELPESAARFLHEVVGPGKPQRQVTLAEVVAQIPPSRLAAHPLLSTDPECRVRHARGQSFPNWVALRSGEFGVFPDGVAYPHNEADVRALLSYAQETGAHLIPYGGGTSVVGHVNSLPGERPVLTVDLGRMTSLRSWPKRTC